MVEARCNTCGMKLGEFTGPHAVDDAREAGRQHEIKTFSRTIAENHVTYIEQLE